MQRPGTFKEEDKNPQMKHIVPHLQSDEGDLKVLVDEMLKADSRNTQILNQFKT